MSGSTHRRGGENRKMRFREKYGSWAVVTGASDGIGKALATEAAAKGLNVLLVARRLPELEALAGTLSSRHEVDAHILGLDLSDRTAADAVTDACERLDVGLLAACAGFGSSGAFTQTDLSAELEMVQVNCKAVLALAHPFARRFAAQRRGGIILMSSLVAFQGVPNSANYAATKAYVQNLAEGMHRELKPFGVDVVASAPGPVATGFAERAKMNMGLASTPDRIARGTIEALGRAITVRPGLIAKGLEASLSVLPRPLRTRIMGQVMAGMARPDCS